MQNSIKQTNKTDSYFLKIAMLNFLLSVLFLIFGKEIDFIERLFGALAINFGFLTFYYMNGKLILKQLEWLKRNNRKSVYHFQKKIINLYAKSTKLITLITIIILIIVAIKNKNYNLFYATVFPFGFFLGGIKLKMGLNK